MVESNHFVMVYLIRLRRSDVDSDGSAASLMEQCCQLNVAVCPILAEMLPILAEMLPILLDVLPD